MNNEHTLKKIVEKQKQKIPIVRVGRPEICPYYEIEDYLLYSSGVTPVIFLKILLK